MPRQIVNPDTLYPSTRYGFSHLAVVTGGRLAYCAGQVAWDEKNELVGGTNMAAQIEQALRNVRTALAAVGAMPSDVVCLRTYLVNHGQADLMAMSAALSQFYGDGNPPAPNTVIGVARLALPEFLVEIEATAVVP